MKQSDQLTLVQSQEQSSKPVFENIEADEQFRRNFFEGIKPALEKWVDARHRSEEQAQRHWSRKLS